MDFSMPAASFCVLLFNYDSLIITMLNGAKNRAISPSFPTETSTQGDITTPPVHFLWKNRLTRTIQTNYKIINHLIIKSFNGLKR